MSTNDQDPSPNDKPDVLRQMIARDDSPPIGGWAITVPQTGARLTELSAASLRGMVRSHLEVNGHEVPRNYREWFEDLLCKSEGLLGSVCAEVPKEMPPQVASLQWSHVERFIKTMWQLHRGSERPKLIEQEEAERRAAICANCPLNVELVIPCRGCRGLIRRAAEVLGGRTTSLDDKLETCSACGCDLKMKIHISNELIDKAEGRSRPEYAEGCWRIKR